MEERILVKGNRFPKSLFLKLGFALALSIAGYFSSVVSKKSGSKSTGRRVRRLKDELRILTSEEELAKVLNGTNNSSSTTGKVMEDEGFLVPGFHQSVMEEFEIYPESKTPLTTSNNLGCTDTGTDTDTYTTSPEECPMVKVIKYGHGYGHGYVSDTSSAPPEECPCFIGNNEIESKTFLESRNEEIEWEEEKLELEQEIGYLRNIVEGLKERERALEVQLDELYGMKEEQGANMRELENRVKVNATESRMLHLKIDSMQANNRTLQSRVSDYPRVAAELEAAREEIKVLKEKMKFEGEDARQRLAALRERITKLQDRIVEDREIGTEVEEKLRRVEELEDEVTDLQKENSRLVEENLELGQQLESNKVAASSHLKEGELEAGRLREENEKLKKEIEQLQTDRCMDVEELVYLRWVNACLRYELRNYQPAPGKTVARDLGKSLSPKSEEKTKQLILQYAHSGTDFDTESCSSRASSDECTDISSSSMNSISSKSKFLGKLRKLLLGKDIQKSKEKSLFESNERRRSFDSISSGVSVENTTGMDSHATEQWLNTTTTTQSQKASRLSFDNIGYRCKSDIGRSHGHMRMISEDESLNGLFDKKDLEDSDVPEKVKLKKFADVLKGSHGSQKLKSKRRSTSFSSN